MKRGQYPAPFDELADPRLLTKLARAAAMWPNRRPVRRAVRWDGLFPIDLPGPVGLAEPAQIQPQPTEPEIRAVVEAGP